MIVTGKKQAEMFQSMIDKVVEVATPRVLAKVLEIQKEQEDESKAKITEQLEKFFEDVEDKINRIIESRVDKSD